MLEKHRWLAIMAEKSKNDFSDWSDSESEVLIRDGETSDSDYSVCLINDDFSSGDEDDFILNARQWRKMNSRHTNYDPSFPHFAFFTGKPDVKTDINEEMTPLDFFNLYFDEELLNRICEDTNKFATQTCVTNWKDVSRAELRIFFALKIHQGIVQMPVEDMHWSKDPLFEMPIYRSVMPFSRYKKIRQCLHFSNNEIYDKTETTHPTNPKYWENEKDLLLPTIHNAKQEVNTSQEPEKKMKVDCEYNFSMDRINKTDHHLANYSVPRNFSKKYYRKIFFHLLDMALWNSYLLYKSAAKLELSPLQYRVKIIRESIEKYRPELPNTTSGRPSPFRHPVRYTPGHFPIELPPSEKKRAPTRRCVICAQKRDEHGKKVRKETRYQCEKCKESMCITPCFKEYHTQ